MLKVTLKRAFKGIWKFHCLAQVDGAEVASAEIMVAETGARPSARPRAGGDRCDDRPARGRRAASARSRRMSRSVPSASSVRTSTIGPGTWIGPHVVINGPTRIGAHNKVFQFASIGDVPQDKKYKGERTRLEIGDRNVFRECVTVNRGTAHGGGVTRIGNDNSVHGLCARRTRLSARRSDRDGELRDAGRPRRARRLGDHGRPVGRASIHQDRCARFPRAQRRRDSRCAALRHGGRPAGRAAQRQLGRI